MANSLRKNPSRKNCEDVIRRILITEVLEHGQNKHFKKAADFMDYFESLYPASESLTKQVQRAVNSMDMPKDEKGFFIVNKTVAQHDQEKEISHLYEVGHVSIDPLENTETIFLACDASVKDHLIYLFSKTDSINSKVITIAPTYNGMIIYTQQKKDLLILLNSLTIVL